MPTAAGLVAAGALYVPWIMGTALLAGCTAATPFVALDGAVLGWAKPLSADERRFVNGSIRYTLGQVIDDDALVESVLRTARDQTPHTLRSWKSARSPTRDRRSEYDAMARDGIDTVLELELVPVFALVEGPDYPLALQVEANARLTSVRDGGVLYNETLVFCCESHTKSQWAADGGGLLRAFFTNAYPLLGERIAEKVFVTTPIGGGGAEQPLAFGLK
jgi:hypothetical protein